MTTDTPDTPLERLLRPCRPLTHPVASGVILTGPDVQRLIAAYPGQEYTIRAYLAPYCMRSVWKVLYDCQRDPLQAALAGRSFIPNSIEQGYALQRVPAATPKNRKR
jgi:hypothetical protein